MVQPQAQGLPDTQAAILTPTPAAAPVAKRSVRATLMDRFTVLSNRNFRLLWIGMLISSSGQQMSIIARSWLAYHISGSAAAIGIVALSRGIPMMTLTLLGGALADRFDKRIILACVHVGMAAIAIANAVLVYMGIVQVWHLMVLGVLTGCAFAFNQPTRQAIIPEIVDREQLPNAMALNSSGQTLLQIGSPAIVGLLIAFDAAIAFTVIAALWLVSIILLFRLPPMRSVRATNSRGTFGDIRDGFSYVRSKPAIILLLAMAIFFILLSNPYQQLLPVVQKELLNVGPSALGLMYTAVGVGGLIGSLAIPFVMDNPHRRLIQPIAGIAFGVFLTAFAFSRELPLSLALLLFIGICTQLYMTMNSIAIMTSTDKGYYGRVMSMNMQSFALIPLVLLPYGLAIDHFGVTHVFMSTGIALSLGLAVVLVIFLRSARFKVEVESAEAATP